MTNKIYAPINAVYVSEFLETLPAGILNKKECGCGATHLALTNNEPTIVAVPTTDLIVNKCSQLPSVFGVWGGTKKEDFHEAIGSSGNPKIMVTYDSLHKVVEWLGEGVDWFNLVVDEYHLLLSEYSYRNKAMDEVLSMATLSPFKKVTFLSATPIAPKFRPAQLEGLDYTEIIWPNVVKVKPIRHKTNKPFHFVSNTIKKFMANGNKLIIEGHEARELYFFMNTVTCIKDIIDNVGLTNKDVKVVCSSSDENLSVLDTIKVSTSIDPNKPITFVTKKAFQGSDFYSEAGVVYVVTNVNKKNTLIDISTELFQISGRIRSINNPFKHLIIHVYNTSPSEISREEFDQMVADKVESTHIQVSSFNRFTDTEKKAWRKRVELDLEDSYSYYNKATNCLEFNTLKQMAEEFRYSIVSEIYSSGLSLREAYIKGGFDASMPVKWDKMEESSFTSSSKRSFKDICVEYIKKIGLNEDVTALEKEAPILVEVRLNLRLEALSSSKYSEKTIREMLYASSKEAKSLIYSRLIKEFLDGVFYPSKYVKETLARVYKECKTIGSIKANMILDYFDGKKIIKKVDGKAVEGYILNIKIVK